jgi:exodeoxyribonuclease III
MNSRKKKSLKIYSWNVNGIRAILKKGFLEWVKKSEADIICLQETKIQANQIPDELLNVKGFKSYWFSAHKKGYSSVCTYTKQEPLYVQKGLGIEKFDVEGRSILTEYDDFVLANIYFPNGGRGPERVEYKLEFYDKLFFQLHKKYFGKKEIIVTGDFNTAHNEIDLARPKENQFSSGFLREERDWIDNIINLGYIDIFRELNKEPNWYTYWDPITRARERNVGWRIDYFIITKGLKDKIKSAKIHNDIFGSDHCPISIDIKF